MNEASSGNHALEALSGPWARAREAVGQLGAKGAAKHLARRALRLLRGRDSYRIILIALSRPRPTPAAAAAAEHHTFHFASADELARLHRRGTPGINPWDVEATLRHDCRCLLQLDGEQLVGYTWVCTAPLIELRWGLHFNMPDDTVYNYNGYTTPPYRGTAYQGLRHLQLLELMKGEHKTRLMGFVDDTNHRSLRGVEKSGYQRIGTLSGVHRGGIKHFSLSVEDAAWSEAVRMGTRQRNAARAAASLPAPERTGYGAATPAPAVDAAAPR